LATEGEDLDGLKEEISEELRDADRRIVINALVGEQDSHSMLDNGSRTFLRPILWGLLEQVDQYDRSLLLQQAIDESNSPYFASHTIGFLLGSSMATRLNY